MELTELLAYMRERHASDLHLVVGQKPIFRIDGHLQSRDSDSVLDAASMEALMTPHLSEEQVVTLDARDDLDITVSEGDRRFRTHVFRDRGGLGAALRTVPNQVPSLERLGLTAESSPTLHALTRMMRGLVIGTGPVGSGKTTLLAAMVEEINATRAERIITIEDPIEYEFVNKQSLISQRQVGEDVPDHASGLRAAMKMDPDVILVDQLRDVETILLALSLAETGHLVFATLNVPTASDAVRRLVESFPEAQRGVIRDMLSRNLQAVVAQMLLPRAAGFGRVPAHEILIGTPTVRRLIAGGETDLSLAIEAGRPQGMQTMDDGLAALVEKGEITRDLAISRMTDKGRLQAPETPIGT